MASRNDKIAATSAENLTHRSGQLLPKSSVSTHAIELSFTRLNNLAMLERRLHSDTEFESEPQLIRLETLEMVEAELKNQAILPLVQDGSSSLSQHLHHEINVWKWRARRHALQRREIVFEINIAKYLIEKAKDLLYYLEMPTASEEDDNTFMLSQPSNPWRINYSNKAQLRAKLYYLDCFAAYQIGKFEQTNDRFKRGLNIVLKSISSRDYFEEESTCKIILPITLPEFIEKLQR